jgi:hypothetical protein
MVWGLFIFFRGLCRYLSTDAAARRPKFSTISPGMTTPDDRARLKDLIKSLGCAETMELVNEVFGPAEVMDSWIEILGSKAKVQHLLNASKVRGRTTRQHKCLARDATIMLVVEMVQHVYRYAGLEPPSRKKLITEILQEAGKINTSAVRRIERHGSVRQILSQLTGGDADAAALGLLKEALSPTVMEEICKGDLSLRSLRFIAVVRAMVRRGGAAP